MWHTGTTRGTSKIGRHLWACFMASPSCLGMTRGVPVVYIWAQVHLQPAKGGHRKWPCALQEVLFFYVKYKYFCTSSFNMSPCQAKWIENLACNTIVNSWVSSMNFCKLSCIHMMDIIWVALNPGFTPERICTRKDIGIERIATHFRPPFHELLCVDQSGHGDLVHTICGL